VWGSPAAGVTVEYPLNLRGASSPTSVMMTPACGWQGAPYRTAQKWFNVPPWDLTVSPKVSSGAIRYSPPYDRSKTRPQRARKG